MARVQDEANGVDAKRSRARDGGEDSVEMLEAAQELESKLVPHRARLI